MKHDIPNGWLDDIRKAAPPALWDRLQAEHDRWLHDFPASPIADLVRFNRLRLYRLSGHLAPAWPLLLSYYPDRRRDRVIHELRFFTPDSAALATPRFDGPLRAAYFVPPADDPGWCAAWRDAESNRPSEWAVNIEERLLYQMAYRAVEQPLKRPLVLPPCFPARADTLSPVWARLRSLALLAADQKAAARAQLALLPAGPDVAPLRARFALERRDWVTAALTPALDSSTVRYLVRVLAPDSALVRLSVRGPRWIRREAALTRAIGRAARSDWAGGAALLAPVDSSRAALWREAGRLHADSTFDGTVRWARFLVRQRGRLMFPVDGDWYRTVASELPRPADSTPALQARGQNPFVPDQTDRIRRHLVQSTERFLALEAYVRAIDRAPAGAPGLAAAVREADRVYRSLIDWRHASTTFWYDRLFVSPEASVIRRAGRRI